MPIPTATKRRPRRNHEVVYSKATMCLRCHLIVELTMTSSGDAWDCPRCRHQYPIKWWKIKRGGSRALDHRADPQQSAAATEGD